MSVAVLISLSSSQRHVIDLSRENYMWPFKKICLNDTTFPFVFRLFFPPLFLFLLLIGIKQVCIVCQYYQVLKSFCAKRSGNNFCFCCCFFFLVKWLELPNHWDKNVFSLKHFSSTIVTAEGTDDRILETQKFYIVSSFLSGKVEITPIKVCVV